ncbi:MAG: LOG family protein [Nitrospinales bacterium]
MPSKEYFENESTTKALIKELVDLCSKPDVAELLHDILTTVIKLGMEHNDTGDYKLINTSLKELRHAMRIFSPYRETRKVTIFGSARTPSSDPCYIMAEQFANEMVENGFMVISGAGPGIMEAANKGAGRDNSFGINIKLPTEQGSNPYINGDPKLMTFKYFFTRKLFFIKESSATVMFPGGMGTQDEGFENMTLFQTGKSMPRPIVLAEPEDSTYWESWIKYLKKNLLSGGFISPDDMGLFYRATSIEDTRDYIKNYYKVYHSLRYVRGKTVLRLNHPIPSSTIEILNDEFMDILINGKFITSGPLEDELKKNEYPDLPRLVFNFNKKNYGRLNKLILRMNQPDGE